MRMENEFNGAMTGNKSKGKPLVRTDILDGVDKSLPMYYHGREFGVSNTLIQKP